MFYPFIHQWLAERQRRNFQHFPPVELVIIIKHQAWGVRMQGAGALVGRQEGAASLGSSMAFLQNTRKRAAV